MEEKGMKIVEKEIGNPDSFMTKVTEFFFKLMDKFTKGKYNTPEEQAFFSDEKNLYWFNEETGLVELTPEYQKKIEEFEEFVRNNSVDDFLSKIHGVDSEEFGAAYNENEMAILKSGLDFVSIQQKLVAEIIEAKMNAKRKGITFDFDTYFRKRVEEDGEDYDMAKENIREYVIEHIEDICNECPELADYFGVYIDTVIDDKSKKDEEA